MRSFLSDCREAFVISWRYGMGDPLAPIRRIGEQGGGRPARHREPLRRGGRASPVRNVLK